MTSLSTLIGQRAVSLATAEETGTVKGLVFEGSRIRAVELSDGMVPTSAVRSFEGDVLTYDGQLTEDLGTASDPRRQRVLDDLGDLVGIIDDLTISADGSVEDVRTTDGDTIPGGRLRAIGSYAAIVSTELPPPRPPAS